MYQLDSGLFFSVALIGVNAVAAWELYLQYRQWKSSFRKKMPSFLGGIVEEKDFENSQAYSRDKGAFSICSRIWSVSFTNVTILTRMWPKMYDWVAGSFPVTVGSFAHCYMYSVAGTLVSELIFLPFACYNQFVIEERHGFNRMTWKEFVKDEIKSFLLQVFLLQPTITALVLEVVRRFGDQFPLYFFGAAVALMASFTFIYPTFIQPLFNTYTPLPDDCPLNKKILNLAKTHDFPLNKVYQVDGSRQSNHSNAYFYGFWKNKRIVLYDTLLKQMKEDDDLILAVLCHEMGHWKYNHTILLLGIGIVQVFCISFGAREVIFNPKMYEAFGFREANAFIGFSIFLQLIVEPLSALLSYAVSFLSRRLEFQADRFAVRSGHGPTLRKGLFIMQKENKSTLLPDPLYAALKYTHPVITERIAAIDEEIKKTN